MPDREHTDPQALDKFYNLPTAPPISRTWYRAIWLWIKEDLFIAPIETRHEDDAVQRRISIHEWGTAGARRLRKLPRDESREILEVTAMLLGFDTFKLHELRTRNER